MSPEPGSLDAQAAHEPLYGTTGDGQILPVHLSPNFVCTIDLEILLPDAPYFNHLLFILFGPVATQRWVAAPGSMKPVG